MNVFDFDNTLYYGESALDFFFYLIRSNKRLLRYLPIILSNLVKYKLCIVDRERLKQTIEKYLGNILKDRQDTLRLVAEFWPLYAHKLNMKLLQLVSGEDLILSAGPSFLLDGIRKSLNTVNIVCSEVDLDCMKISFFNFKDNKMNRFRELYGREKIDCFYTDSYNDRSIMDIAEKVFLVRKNRVKQIK